MKPKSFFDENLRDIPVDEEKTRAYVNQLKSSLRKTLEPREQVRLLGEIAAYQRQLGDLELSEQNLRHALEIIDSGNLGIQFETQQKIRLAHTLQ